MEHLNFPEEVKKMVKQFPLSRVAELRYWAHRRAQSEHSSPATPMETDQSSVATPTSEPAESVTTDATRDSVDPSSEGVAEPQAKVC